VAGVGFLVAVAPYLEREEIVLRFPAPETNIEVRLPLYLPAPPPRPARSGAQAAAAAPAAAPRGETPTARRTFELPPVPVRPDTQLTLLQPPTPKTVPPPKDLKLPQIVQWSVQPPKKPVPKPFVSPGTIVRASEPPSFNAPPALEVPNAVPQIRDLRMAETKVPDRPVALPVPPASPAPVRTFVPPAPRPQPAAIELFQGDPVNIVALSPPPDTVGNSVRLPPGSQIAAPHRVEAPPGPPAPKEPGQAKAGVPAGTGVAPSGQTGSGSAQAANVRGNGAAGTGSANGPAGQGFEAGAGAGSVLSTAATLRVDSPGAVPIRIEHPDTRVFDVVVVQSAAPGDASGVGILSGTPVYTVYLPVGRQKPWVMQYCIPKETAIKAKKGIAIQLGSPSKVSAPFPRVTVVPPASATHRVMIHGLINENGRFENIRVVAGDKVADEMMVVPLLQRWVFRPAVRDGKPVTVEAVLVLPSDRN
jgi:hypothetical protein